VRKALVVLKELAINVADAKEELVVI